MKIFIGFIRLRIENSGWVFEHGYELWDGK